MDLIKSRKLQIPRIIASLLLKDRGFYKTKKFKNPVYVGDPINTVRLFNDKGADEICILDISASSGRKKPDFDYIQDVVSECFMPVSYGGGITTLEDAKKLFDCGVEKVCFGTALYENPKVIEDVANHYGTQAVAVSLDVKKNLLGHYQTQYQGLAKKSKLDPVKAAKIAENVGAGELLLTAIDHEGSRQGYDLKLLKMFHRQIVIPIVMNGGASNLQHFVDALQAGAAAVAVGTMFVFKSETNGVLVSYPGFKEVEKYFHQHHIEA